MIHGVKQTLIASTAAMMCFCTTLSYGAKVDIPYLTGIQIDGDASDWGDRGFRVEMMTHRNLEGCTADDFEPRYRLGWNDEGLLLLLTVQDDVPIEQSLLKHLWSQDSARISMSSDRAGRPGYVVFVAPGVDPENPGTKYHFEDSGNSIVPRDYLSATAVGAKIEGGYILEILLPWDNLALEPGDGVTLDFMLTVGDIDKRDETLWFSGWNADSAYQLCLARKASPPVKAYTVGNYHRFQETKITVCAVRELAGQRVQIRQGKNRLGEARLEERSGRALATISLPIPPVGETWDGLEAIIRGQAPLPIALPDLNEIRARTFTEARIRFQSYIFTTNNFPPVDFVDSGFEQPWLGPGGVEVPSFVESLIGPYQIKTTFYDSDMKEVTQALKPGRYGAMVEVIPESGRPTRRFETLFRLPEGVGPWKLWFDTDLNMTLRLPDALGVVVDAQSPLQQPVNRFFRHTFLQGLSTSREGGLFLAGLLEQAGDATPLDPVALNHQWWVQFKRQFYGLDQRYPKPFVCPHPLEGAPAPVLREGSLKEAGMKEDAAEKIDAVLTEWAENSDEPFTVCVARHGVIILHKAYGERGGKPMTLDTPTWMASITKMMSASLMMMLVDQGWVDMDAPVAEYLPPFQNEAFEKPITIRNLYTHTGGLWGHWGDPLSDLEEILADYAPFLASDKISTYNGVGNALGSKILELLSGKSLAQFYQDHLLVPLDCPNTEVTGSMGDARSVALDMAKIAQMYLNRGAYGDMQFMRPETFERMFPAPMTRQFGENTSVVKGFGCHWMSEEGLSPRTLGHGAASSATFRLDLDQDLVIVMCRESAGKNFNEYHPKFIRAVVNGIER